jgi:dolichyl-phosphate-mannose-protein mannosyltransferase
MIRQRKQNTNDPAVNAADQQPLLPEKPKPAYLKVFSQGQLAKRSHVHFVCIVLTVLAILSRFLFIDHPNEVVFDEVHFGKFGAYYLERTYYFDVHPPLGKLLIAGAGYAGGFNGTFKFDKIGDSYIDNQIPYIIMRAPEALLGALLVPLVFMILIETDHSLSASALGASMVLFGNFFRFECIKINLCIHLQITL